MFHKYSWFRRKEGRRRFVNFLKVDKSGTYTHGTVEEKIIAIGQVLCPAFEEIDKILDEAFKKLPMEDIKEIYLSGLTNILPWETPKHIHNWGGKYFNAKVSLDKRLYERDTNKESHRKAG